jgi:integrase
MSAPIRRKIEAGIFERVDGGGNRLGLEIQYKDAGGKPRRRSVKGATIHDARDQLAKARTQRARHELEPADVRMTLDAVIDHYEVAALPLLRPRSQVVRRAALRRIRPALGHKRMTSINRADVRAWVGTMISDELKANTIRAYYSTLRALFTFAAGDLEVPVTFPKLKPGELPDPADDQREHRVLSDDELRRVLEACEPRWSLYFRTLAETGARASEALGLTPEQVGDGTVRFTAQLAPDGTLRPLKTRTGKRTIEVTRGLSAELRLAGDRERVFPRFAYHQAGREWARALKRAKLDGPPPVLHDLRHTHASRLIALGWDPVEIASRLGDRLETVLRVYTHEFDARRRSAGRRAALEQVYGSPKHVGKSTGLVKDGYQMATHTPSQAITDGAKVQRLRSHQNTA